MSNKLENRLIAKRYALALMGVAGDNAAAVASEAQALQEVCALADVQRFLHNPLLSRTQSAEVVEVLLSKIGASEALKGTVVRMAHNRRLPVLADMLEQFVLLVEAAAGIMRVKIVSAKALSDADISQLADKIAKRYDCALNVETQVDPSLIGGVQLRMGDRLIDYSVASKLERLRAHLKHSSLPSVQAGAL